MTHDEPACALEKLTPCTPHDWAQCDKCHRLVCLVHADIYEIYGSGELAFSKAYSTCQRCIDEGWELGEWSVGEFAQWVNFR